MKVCCVGLLMMDEQMIYLRFTCEAILQVVRWPRGAGSCFQLLNAPWGSRCKAALSMMVDVDSTMWPGSAFHASIIRLEKKCFVFRSNLALGFYSFSMCPLDFLSIMLKWVAMSTVTKSLGILKTSNRSALSRRFSSDISPVCFRVLRRLGQRWRESFWSLYVVPFQCLECPSLDRVTRPVSSTPDVVSPMPCTVHGITVCTTLLSVTVLKMCPAIWFAFLTATAQLTTSTTTPLV